MRLHPLHAVAQCDWLICRVAGRNHSIQLLCTITSDQRRKLSLAVWACYWIVLWTAALYAPGAPGKDHEIRGWALVMFQIYLPITAFSVTCPCGSYTTGRNQGRSQECKVEGGLPNPFQHTFTQLLIMKFHKRWGIWNKCLRREEGRHTDGHCFRYTEK